MFLEQYTILNRRPPDHGPKVLTAEEEFERSKIYICTTMVCLEVKFVDVVSPVFCFLFVCVCVCVCVFLYFMFFSDSSGSLFLKNLLPHTHTTCTMRSLSTVNLATR